MSTEGAALAKRRRSFASLSVALFERVMPDPLILAIGLTAFVALAAAIFAPQGTLPVILTSWYSGHVQHSGLCLPDDPHSGDGHALAHAPLVQRGLKRLVATVRTPNQAMTVTFLAAAASPRGSIGASAW